LKYTLVVIELSPPEATAAKQLLNYICMPNPFANATFVCHHEACIDSQPVYL
jgi:hypothetical protein